MNPGWYVPIGFLVGTYGTIIGAGGGFIIVPLLVFLFPADGPSMITAASLAVICVNAASGTAAYAVQKRISYRTGIFFAAATIPGALLGSYLTSFISKRVFGIVFGVLLVAVAATLGITRSLHRSSSAPPADHAPLLRPGQVALGIENARLYKNALYEKNKTEAILKSIGDGVVTLDWERKITSFNPASVISNNPTSCVEPNRFFTQRTMRCA